MIDTLLLILALLALLAGSIVDFKKREVPDWVSYGLIFAALGVRLISSVSNNDYTIIFAGFAGFAAFFILSNILYFLKQWGGGDAKLLMGLGAVIGLNIFSSGSYLTLGLFIVLSIFVGAIYGLFFSGYLAFKNKKAFKKSFNQIAKEYVLLLRFSSILLIVGLVGLVLISDFNFAILLFGVFLIFFVGIYSFAFTKAVEESCLYQKLKVKQLTEGDWVAETIKIKGRTLITESNLGITKQQINKLKNYKKLILVKSGIPFVPALFLAYLALIYYKDVLLGLL